MTSEQIEGVSKEQVESALGAIIAAALAVRQIPAGGTSMQSDILKAHVALIEARSALGPIMKKFYPLEEAEEEDADWEQAFENGDLEIGAKGRTH